MTLTRRDFLRVSGAAAAGVLAGRRIDLTPVEAYAYALRIRDAKVFPGVCPSCAVGCPQLVHVKDGTIVHIEGDPGAPHTEGALCAKGAATYQLSINERRWTKAMYRAPGSERWEAKPLAWMMEQIAQRVKATRDATFVERVKAGNREVTVNRCEGIAWLGSAALDNEEHYLSAKLSRALGLVNVDNAARLGDAAAAAALTATFGRGAATASLVDVQNADVIMAAADWAESHPVSYRWVLKARERGARTIHVGPRFTRTSAAADIWVPIRPGTHIVFFGALIRYAIHERKYFHDYVLAHTNAAFLVDPTFKTPTDLDGLFSGYNPAGRRYDPSTWRFQLDADGYPRQDLTLRDPNCVFQLLRRHFARYTPEMVERVCGISKDLFLRVADIYCSASGPDRTATVACSLELTQSTNGVQQVRALSILQLLLGNIGRPGGGVCALGGHANAQGAADCGALSHILPGAAPAPLQGLHPTLMSYLVRSTPRGGSGVNHPKLVVSLLKAWWGASATRENDFAFDYLPKRDKADAHSYQHILAAMDRRAVKGLVCVGENPAASGSNAGMARAALRKLEWMVVVDLFETDTAAVWKEPGIDPRSSAVEVFFIPGAPAAEKDGSLTNAMRLVQWHTRAADPPGDARSEAAFVVELGTRLKELYRESEAKKDRPILDLVWEYEPDGPRQEPRIELVLKEINGYATDDITGADGTLLYRKGDPLRTSADLRDDGSTACGNWLYAGVYPEEGTNLAARREKPREGDALAHAWGFVWPADRRILYNRASADARGKPWSEQKKLVWWDPEQQRWAGFDLPDFAVTTAPDAPRAREGPLKGIGGVDAFIANPDGKGQLFASVVDGPLPEHYEPYESPTQNLLSGVNHNPVATEYDVGGATRLGTADRYPYVLTTCDLAEHDAAGRSRHVPWLAELFAGPFAEIGRELAKELGIENGEAITVETARAAVSVRAMVTDRLRPFVINGRKIHLVGIPWQGGYAGGAKSARGGVTSDLVASLGDPTTFAPESRALLCNIRKGAA